MSDAWLLVCLTIALVSSAHFFGPWAKNCMSTPQYFYIILLPSPGRIECQEVACLYRLHVELEDLEYQNTVHALPKKRGRYKGRGKRKWKGYIWLRIRRGAREFNIGIYYIDWLVAAKRSWKSRLRNACSLYWTWCMPSRCMHLLPKGGPIQSPMGRFRNMASARWGIVRRFLLFLGFFVCIWCRQDMMILTNGKKKNQKTKPPYQAVLSFFFAPV